jgi:hypothetical protein
VLRLERLEAREKILPRLFARLEEVYGDRPL